MDVGERERCWGGEYSSFPIVDVSDLFSLCEDFANKSTNNYADRGQTDQENIKRQTIFGKLGEFIAYRSLFKFVRGLTEPDVEIKKVRDKSYDCDMVSDGYNFAVKSCSRFSSFPVSWIIQSSDINGYGRDKFIFKRSPDANDFVLMVIVDDDACVGRIVATPALLSLHDLELFETPLSRNIRDYKKAIYWSSLVEKRLVPSMSKRSFGKVSN
jgi:hypothetical protein